ncbi:NUDIX domain-containing protein [Candidatus Bathyarchaeota archaeon]|nr:NUDIX domain-containing protein [Candidatus Bathyarchaeota archaeon]
MNRNASQQEIKAKALCVFQHEDKILVAEYNNAEKDLSFYRPMGGTIEFYEHSEDALEREIQEELNQPIKDLVLLGVIENRYYSKGKLKHEILFIYDGRFLDESLYDQDTVVGYEVTSNRRFKGLWISIHDILEGKFVLYPEDLLGLLVRTVFDPLEMHGEGLVEPFPLLSSRN